MSEQATETAQQPSAPAIEAELPGGGIEGFLSQVEAQPAESEASPAEATAETEESKEPSKAKAKPKKAKAENPIESKVEGLQKWNNRLSQKMSSVEKTLEMINKKIDGTYTEPPEPTTRQVEAAATLNAKESVSRSRAIKEYGEEYLQEQILGDDSPYRQLVQEHPWIYNRVMRSDDMYAEAFQVLQEFEFFNEYGHNPEEIKAKLTEELRGELEKEMKASVGKKVVGSKPPSLSNVRSADNAKEKVLPPEQRDVYNFNPGLTGIT